MIVLNIPFPLILLYWYAIISVMVFFYYSLWYRFEDDRVSDGKQKVYLSFCIIGMLGYMALAAPFWLMSYKYSTTRKLRTRRLQLGCIGMFFTGTVVLFSLDLDFTYTHGIVGVLQGTVFVLQFISFFTGAMSVWFIYMWNVASYLHRKTGTDRLLIFRNQGMPTDLRAPPPLGWNKPLPGQPDIV